MKLYALADFQSNSGFADIYFCNFNGLRICNNNITLGILSVSAFYYDLCLAGSFCGYFSVRYGCNGCIKGRACYCLIGRI